MKEELANDAEKLLFFTSDLGCSATLISLGHELMHLDKSEPRKVKFIFKKVKGIEETVDNYWADKIEIKARSLIDNIRMLKNRIYSR